MRIRKVAVHNLFGIFNHEIPLNLDDHITIIHGPNGFGKTVILRLLNSFFNSQYQQLREVRYGSLTLTLEDTSEITISHTGSQDEDASADSSQKNSPKANGDLVMRYRPKSGKAQHHTIKRLLREDLDFPIGALEHEIPGLDRIGPDLWLYEPTQERLSTEDVLERYGFGGPTLRRRLTREPEWLQQLKESVSIRFIETQRLLLYTVARHQREFQRRGERQLPLVPAVANYSDELVSAIQVKLAEYAALSQSLDRSFPTRLVKGSLAPDLTLESLRTNLQELETKRSQLMSVGLLDIEGEVDLRDFQAIEASNRNVLSVYIGDVSQKLAVFDELTRKIDLLVRIINSRFTHKEMSVNKRGGFVFSTPDGKELRSTGLSSGEQHELVLFYELLFKITPNSLILIDEPELSLHVLWQQQFLKDLQEVIQLREFDVLIATHSPQIINDRWDLTVELRRPVDATVPHPQ